MNETETTPTDNVSPGTPTGLLAEILAYERRVRGIDWMTDLFDEQGAEKPQFIEQKMYEAASGLSGSQVGSLVAEGHQLHGMLGAAKYRGDNAGSIVRFKEGAYKVLYDAKDGDIKDKLLKLLGQLQELEGELKSGDFDYNLVTKVFAGVGAVATAGGVLITMWSYASGAVGLVSFVYAVVGFSAAVAIGAVLAIVGVLIIAVVGTVVLMLKQATELHLVLNNTDYELRIYEVYCRHGKVLATPMTDTYRAVIPARAMVEMQDYDGKRLQRVIHGGYFGMSKKDGALYGADGVIQLDMYKDDRKHQYSTFLAYEVPLMGKNGCYVKCSAGNPSAAEFFRKYEGDIEYGNWESTDRYGNIAIRKRINSLRGSDCYAITTYEQI